MAQRLTPDMIKRAGYGMDHPDYQGSPDEKSWFEHSYMPRLAARGEEVPEGYELVPAMQDVKLDRKWGFFDVNGDFRQMGIGMSYRVMPYNYIVYQAKNPPAPLVAKWSCRHNPKTPAALYARAGQDASSPRDVTSAGRAIIACV
jgi:hypothetical protein